MGTTPVCQITEAGIIRPTFENVMGYFQSAYRGIYGQDVYLGADSQDGQFMALLANAIHDANGETVAAYNSFSPSTAVGVPLDRVVKINGIRRKRATYSTAPFRLVGQAGITITDGAVRDPSGNLWALPPTVLIDDTGEVTVTATCQVIGAITLPAYAVDTANGGGSIATPTFGWQEAQNTAAASKGQPVEPDSALRQRQSASVALPSQTLTDGLYGALSSISGVNRLRIYENDDGVPDGDGVPGHCLSVVLDGGDAAAIANVIRLKKGPGVSTYGSTVQTTVSTSGLEKEVSFFYLAQVPIGYGLIVRNLGGFTQSVEAQIRAALTAFTNGLTIGEDVRRDQAFAAAKLYDGPGSKTYRIEAFSLGRVEGALTESDAPIAFNEAAMGDIDSISITVLPA